MKTDEIRVIMDRINYLIEHSNTVVDIANLKQIWNDLADIVTKYEQHPSSLESLIERVEMLKVKNPQSEGLEYYNAGIKDVLQILRTTPCIKAKALRKRGTDLWLYKLLTGAWITGAGIEALIQSVDCVNRIKPVKYPEYAELIDIEILINEP